MNKRSAAVMNWRNRTKQQLVEYKGGECDRCGYNKPIWNVYEFHHLDTKQKDFSISGKSWSFERLKEEVDKCQLLCGNCHKEVHWEISQKSRLERHGALEKAFLTNECKYCKMTFRQRRKTVLYCCRDCYNKDHNRTEIRPDCCILKSDVESMTWVAMGKKYGVSDNTVRKWAKNYGLI